MKVVGAVLCLALAVYVSEADDDTHCGKPEDGFHLIPNEPPAANPSIGTTCNIAYSVIKPYYKGGTPITVSNAEKTNTLYINTDKDECHSVILLAAFESKCFIYVKKVVLPNANCVTTEDTTACPPSSTGEGVGAGVGVVNDKCVFVKSKEDKH